MIDSLEYRIEEKKRISKKKDAFVDLRTIPVRVNAKTVIWIKPTDDPQEKVKQFLDRTEKESNQQNNYHL